MPMTASRGSGTPCASSQSLILFAGDMIGFGYCFAFKGLVILVKLIYGNNDGDRHGLQNFPSGV